MAVIKKILSAGSNSGRNKQRNAAFIRLGYQLDIISETANDVLPSSNDVPTLFARICNKLGFPLDQYQINRRILLQCMSNAYDVLWVSKCMVLKPKTLKKIKRNYPHIILVWFSEDDMFAHHNQSYYFRKSLPYYDLVFTTKSYNCNPDELPAMGAKQVVFVNKGYDPIEHAPVSIDAEAEQRFGADVGFVGTFETDRAHKMLWLAERGIKIRIWGNGWQAWVGRHPNLQVENKPVYHQDYCTTLCSTKINLCFLRKANRDLQTDRTMEIPACGAFMLAERTAEHQNLFIEDKEAAYFDINHPEELLTKIQYYLQHETERQAIAQAGRARCLTSGYSHDELLKHMLDTPIYNKSIQV